MTAQPNNRTRAQREIHTGFDIHETIPDARRLYAECDDEVTSFIVINIGDLVPLDAGAFEASEWPKLLLAEHLERCDACAAWRWS